MDFCPVDWTGNPYPCPFHGGMDTCKKLSGGCIPRFSEKTREALLKKGYPRETIRDMGV